mmetsp:Transcript_7709/g.16080  ORF Transcript_7709/g.16080 Transcript_7709/m.16080 type:complete len:91 (-) Transcript_7709:1008-1280(-)
MCSSRLASANYRLTPVPAICWCETLYCKEPLPRSQKRRLCNVDWGAQLHEQGFFLCRILRFQLGKCLFLLNHQGSDRRLHVIRRGDHGCF